LDAPVSRPTGRTNWARSAIGAREARLDVNRAGTVEKRYLVASPTHDRPWGTITIWAEEGSFLNAGDFVELVIGQSSGATLAADSYVSLLRISR